MNTEPKARILLVDDQPANLEVLSRLLTDHGYRVRAVRQVMHAFMSPGSVTERLHFFVAEYDSADRIGAGGGLEAEGEDIEVFEADFDAALAMVADGRIADGKTIMLLQYAALHLFARR